ncbi:MAG: excinuclease ABC subunit UvrA [Clostridiaceae bacterium]|jgi:excinuclease ABC subunit A|nr:excinuclease ABC subunit UvrA [Oscillospiraceae bacterium]NLO63118.1 excinuclease ABC subunit UvrA [Clostridiaceae bacterium]
MIEFIEIRGAREHNLKNIDVDIPREKLVVLTGLSGSGKSSLAFDTIYAEGQRRYVESLSSYARQFLGQMEKPDIDRIDGLSPAISIDQKTTSKNPRSTVGTVTEIYDYLRLLYARVGTPHCPECGKEISSQSVDQIVDTLLKYPEGTRAVLMAPVVRGRKGEYAKLFEELRKAGYARIRVDGEMFELDEDIVLDKNKKHSIEVVVDRVIIRRDIQGRLGDSVESTVAVSDGLLRVSIQIPEDENEFGDVIYKEEELLFSQKYSCPDCGIGFEELNPRMFSFNNPFGACPDCSGIGSHSFVDPLLCVTDPDKSINEGAIRTGGWNMDDDSSWGRAFILALSKKYSFSLDVPWKDLSQGIRDLILFGNDGEVLQIDTRNSKYSRGAEYRSSWQGIVPSLERRYRETGSEDMKEYYEQFMNIHPCPSCGGARLNKRSLSVTVGDYNIYELTCLPIRKCLKVLDNLVFSERNHSIAEPIIKEIRSRLGFLLDVGLDYLSLSRASATLSGGESQRIRLATQIGSGLMGVLYILDEPSIGLHQRDNAKLLRTLKRLRDLGNTVLVVEHDEETMREADCVIDLGPGAGEHGGELIAIGSISDIMNAERSITGQYMSGKKYIPIPLNRRRPNGHYLSVNNARENNLREISVRIPLGLMTCVTGVSGSGKSSLVNGIILKKLAADLNGAKRQFGSFDSMEGLEYLDKVIAIDQSPIGRTPRSNPATYTGCFDLIRDLFAGSRDARARGFLKGRFSFNVKGGRCEACGGDGVNRIEMHFLPDVYVTCDVCKGKRYNRETLEVKYKGKSIADVLEMTVDEALSFFSSIPRIRRKLETLADVGMGYIRLGQPSTQLSGGEAQRVKLATELSKRSTGRTFYILDEPTTGLHIADVHKLVDILQRLTENGNTVLVIEHNLDVIKTADYIIDLGPEGGDKGGTVVASGTPEEVANHPTSYTGQYLAPLLEKARNFGPLHEVDTLKFKAEVDRDLLEIQTSVKPRRRKVGRETKDK